MLNTVLATIDQRQHQSLSSLKEFLAIPSVSTQPEHQPDMQRCATWLADQLRFAHFEVAILPTGGHPCVIAKNKHVSGRPTVLLYGHYDVQPPEPLDLWKSPAFEPTVRKTSAGTDAIYARGAADDKGQVWCHVEALTAWQAHGGVPVNVTLLIEGEEEIGSAHLRPFMEANKDALKADIAIVSDTSQFARGKPALTTGLRGLLYTEIFLTGPSHDLHSGVFGGSVPNPANVLCKLLASLHDENHRVTIPGFYDDVAELSPQEKQAWAELPFDEAGYMRELGLSELSGEAGFTTLERRWSRPTLDINGITTGYQGPGAKTVIPSQSSAKVSMRLVPNQNPEKIFAAYKKFLEEKCPRNVQIKVTQHSYTPAVLVPADTPATKLAMEALEAGFGVKPTLMREGGSIPVVSMIKKILGIDTLLVGLGLPDDALHSPNEKFDLDCLYGGTRAAAALYEKLAKMPTRSLPIR